MTTDRYERYGATTGIIAVILLIVGFGVFTASAPKMDASATNWANWYALHQNRIQLGLTIVGVGGIFYLWFLGSLRAALARAEGGTHRLANVAFGGGIFAGAFILVAISAAAAASLRAGPVDPAITQALNDVSLVTAAPAAAGFTALFAATAIVGYRHRPFAPSIAGFSALAAIGQLLAYGTVFTDTGAFAADGAVGLFVPFATFAVAILLLSAALMRGGASTAGAQ